MAMLDPAFLKLTVLVLAALLIAGVVRLAIRADKQLKKQLKDFKREIQDLKRELQNWTRCPHCSQAVSRQAISCPHCGRPLNPPSN